MVIAGRFYRREVYRCRAAAIKDVCPTPCGMHTANRATCTKVPTAGARVLDIPRAALLSRTRRRQWFATSTWDPALTDCAEGSLKAAVVLDQTQQSLER